MDLFSRKLKIITWPRDKYKDEYLKLASELNSVEPYALFIGAGISKNPYPDWRELVEFISSEISVRLTIEEESDKASYGPQILEKCRAKDHKRFYSILREKFSPKGKIEYKPLHLDLLTLPLVGFITTNIDTCLLKAATRLTGKSKLNGFYYYPDHLPSAELKNRNLFHIHGVAINHNDEDTIERTILTGSDYENGYPCKIEPFLLSAFNDVCIVFIGFSLRDPAIQRVLEICKKYQEELEKLTISRTSKSVNRYIFLQSIYRIDSERRIISKDEQAEDKVDEKFLNTYNLHVIRYHSYYMAEHTELNNIINNLIIKTEKTKFGG